MPRYRKRLGQHHLVAGALCRPLIEFLRPASARVVEIGPGGGVLTAELLAAGADRVLAIELDLEWALPLARRLDDRRLAIAVADAVAIPWQRLSVPTLVAGNLPYNVATPIIERLLPHRHRVPRASFLVQREVAERLAARPGDAAYGALSVLVASRARVSLLARVKRGSFHPPPRVEGAYVGLELIAPPLPDAEMPAFEATVRLAFARRRKQLVNALAAGWGREGAAAALEGAGIASSARAEELDGNAFVALHRARQRRLKGGRTSRPL